MELSFPGTKVLGYESFSYHNEDARSIVVARNKEKNSNIIDRNLKTN